jgi:hypothetical protein
VKWYGKPVLTLRGGALGPAGVNCGGNGCAIGGGIAAPAPTARWYNCRASSKWPLGGWASEERDDLFFRVVEMDSRGSIGSNAPLWSKVDASAVSSSLRFITWVTSACKGLRMSLCSAASVSASIPPVMMTLLAKSPGAFVYACMRRIIMREANDCTRSFLIFMKKHVLVSRVLRLVTRDGVRG